MDGGGQTQCGALGWSACHKQLAGWTALYLKRLDQSTTLNPPATHADRAKDGLVVTPVNQTTEAPHLPTRCPTVRVCVGAGARRD